MIREAVFKKQFRKDLERIKRTGREMTRLLEAIESLCSGTPLPPQFRDHPLVGNYEDYRECDLGGDWLLIYQMTDDIVILVRMGSHSDLFD